MYFCTIFLFFTSISAQFLYFSPVSLHNFSIFHPRFGKITVFSSVFLINISQSQHLESNCIYQVYSSTVFRNCILQVYFPTGRKLRMRGCEATDRAPGGYRLPGTKWGQATPGSGLRPLTGPQSVACWSCHLRPPKTLPHFYVQLVNLCYSFVWK